MSDSIPIDEKLGLNPALTVCGICGEPNGELALIGRSTVWKHRCGAITVAYFGRGPGTFRDLRCDSCGESAGGRDWTDEGPYDKEQHGPLAGHDPCARCKEWLQTACLVRCDGCRRVYQRFGVYRAVKPHDRAEYGDDHEKGVTMGLLEPIVGRLFRVKQCDFCDPARAADPPTDAREGA